MYREISNFFLEKIDFIPWKEIIIFYEFMWSLCFKKVEWEYWYPKELKYIFYFMNRPNIPLRYTDWKSTKNDIVSITKLELDITDKLMDKDMYMPYMYIARCNISMININEIDPLELQKISIERINQYTDDLNKPVDINLLLSKLKWKT